MHNNIWITTIVITRKVGRKHFPTRKYNLIACISIEILGFYFMIITFWWDFNAISKNNIHCLSNWELVVGLIEKQYKFFNLWKSKWQIIKFFPTCSHSKRNVYPTWNERVRWKKKKKKMLRWYILSGYVLDVESL